MKKTFITLVLTMVTAVFIPGAGASQTSIFTADALFAKKDYQGAMQQYRQSAKIGNAHAYYQIATLYNEGLGVKVNSVKALMFYALAAEYQFHDSVQIVAETFAHMTEQQRANNKKLVAALQKKHGKAPTQLKYFPQLNSENINTKVIFGDGEALSNQLAYINEVLDFSDADVGIAYGSIGSFDNNVTGYADEDYDAVAYSDTFIEQFTRPFILVADYEIASDGSIRNIVPIETFGHTERTLYDLSLESLPSPKFNGEPVGFINRVFIGMVNWHKYRIRREHKALYARVRRAAEKLKHSDNKADKYQYAIRLLRYPWLDQKKGEAIQLLENLAQQGYPQAQYEYGLHLYRQQQDPAQAIKWLSEASKSGLVNAEYRLGTLLQDSPWVITDEKKALFWFEKSVAKHHPAAVLKVVELKLLANDKSLHNDKEADDLLQSIDGSLYDSLYNNPSYHYLTAVSHFSGDNSNMKQVFKSMRQAISLGGRLNWDVTEWEDMLATWLQGSITVTDK